MDVTQIVLIHGGESTATKLAAALPGARVAVVYRQGLSGVYDENTGIAKEYPTLRGLLSVFAPEWKPGEPLVVLGYSAGAWALRYYLRDAAARADVTAAIFLDGLYGAPGGVCNMAPYQGVLAYAKEANANPASKRLVMTYSKAHPGPDVCSEAIKAAAPGDGVFTRAANNADHGAQQGVVGPAVVKDLIAPWIGGSSSAIAARKSSWGWVVGGALLVGAAWHFGRGKLLENPTTEWRVGSYRSFWHVYREVRWTGHDSLFGTAPRYRQEQLETAAGNQRRFKSRAAAQAAADQANGIARIGVRA